MTWAWWALAALLVQDPVGDAHGAGDLTPPQAPAYASVAPFDLVEVEVSDTVPVEVRIELAGIADPASLPVGITLPVIDVYLGDGGPGERDASLLGPGMAFPPGRGWTWAVRVHGDGAVAVRARDGLRVDVPAERQGDAVVVTLPRAAPPEFRSVQAVTGVYDPFGEDAWRAFRSEASPWTFATPRPAPPVVDVLAPDAEAQTAALRTATFPRSGGLLERLVWPLVAVVGVALLVAATLQRWRTGRARRAAASPPTGGEAALDLIDVADLSAALRPDGRAPGAASAAAAPDAPPPNDRPTHDPPPDDAGPDDAGPDDTERAPREAGDAKGNDGTADDGTDDDGTDDDGTEDDDEDGDVVRSVVRLDTPPSRHG